MEAFKKKRLYRTVASLPVLGSEPAYVLLSITPVPQTYGLLTINSSVPGTAWPTGLYKHLIHSTHSREAIFNALTQAWPPHISRADNKTTNTVRKKGKRPREGEFTSSPLLKLAAFQKDPQDFPRWLKKGFLGIYWEKASACVCMCDCVCECA